MVRMRQTFLWYSQCWRAKFFKDFPQVELCSEKCALDCVVGRKSKIFCIVKNVVECPLCDVRDGVAGISMVKGPTKGSQWERAHLAIISTKTPTATFLYGILTTPETQPQNYILHLSFFLQCNSSSKYAACNLFGHNWHLFYFCNSQKFINYWLWIRSSFKLCVRSTE